MRAVVLILLFTLSLVASSHELLDLSFASIFVAPASPARAHIFANLLRTEVHKRCGLWWPVSNGSTSTSNPVVSLKIFPGGSSAPEGYVIEASPSDGVTVHALDERGLLFGIGRLLRVMNLSLVEDYWHPRTSSATLPSDFKLSSNPDSLMRGVQVGYRPKTNSYDGLTPALFEQFVVDLAFFGVNQIELIPHAFDDAPYSPHYDLPHGEMNTVMSQILDKYGLNVSLWFPACDPTFLHSNAGCIKGDYNDPVVMEAAKKDWHQVFSSMPRIDTLFINAGDPGEQSPDDLVMLTQVARGILRQYHPHAETWICPQDWNTTQYSRWLELLDLPQTKSWLAGIIYGPGMPVSLPSFANTSFLIRLYPDITHSVNDQLPVPNWDPVFQWTEYRETINPRPRTEGMIAASQKKYATAGIGTYNEGCHDDVNKVVWASVFWGCDDDGDATCETDTLVRKWLQEYSRFHFGSHLEAAVTEGIYGLEKNWVGAAIGNSDIQETYRLFQEVAKQMTPRDRWSWRLQQLLYRAHYDLFIQERATIQRAGEAQARAILSNEASTDPTKAMEKASAVLAAASKGSDESTVELWTEIRVWAEALYQSIHEQFSVPIYGGEYTRRGNTIDTAHLPLSDAPYMLHVFGSVQNKSTAAQVDALQELVSRTDPGAGGYYDDLGELSAQPHYVHDIVTMTGDQAIWPEPKSAVTSPSDQYYDIPGKLSHTSKTYSKLPPALPSDVPRSQMTWVSTDGLLPIILRYPQLGAGLYTISFSGMESKTGSSIVVIANGVIISKGEKPSKHGHEVSFDIPEKVTSKEADLEVHLQAAGGVQAAEVWLRRKPAGDLPGVGELVLPF